MGIDMCVEEQRMRDAASAEEAFDVLAQVRSEFFRQYGRGVSAARGVSGEYLDAYRQQVAPLEHLYNEKVAYFASRPR
ncbi:MAG: hypothetical protein HC945_03300 [Nitrosarchaeum sp.]|nr:hypothetical protein [Nitrosarchaeum sp.]